MYWKYLALTKFGNEITGSMQGRREEVIEHLINNHLMVVSANIDIETNIKEILRGRKLSYATLSTFFIDFSRMLGIGLSIYETIRTLSETTNNELLRDSLRSIAKSIKEGATLKASFEKTKIFPDIVNSTLDAAEKSGTMPEIMAILSNYFNYLNDSKNKIVKALIYPILVLISLTIALVVISKELVPQLGALLPESATNKWSTKMLMSYASFMKDSWWVMFLVPVVVSIIFIIIWRNNKDEVLSRAYSLPVLGNLLKEVGFATYFLTLYVYQKSGVPIISSITNIHKSQESYISKKFMHIKKRLMGGACLWESIKNDSFFPSFIQHNIRKGEEQGNYVEYFSHIYKYYDSKSRETINTSIGLINPILLTIAFAVLGTIVTTFFVPIYGTLGQMTTGIYK